MIKKYLVLYWAFFRASLAADVEFRANFAARFVTDVLWYVAQVTSFEVIYRFTPRIGDWNVSEMRVFLGLLFVVDAFYMIVFSENLDSFSEKVRRGQLDLLLAKPMNAQFMISLQKANTAILGNLALGSSWLVWALLQLPHFVWWRLLWLLLLIPCGLTAFYAMRFFFSAISVIVTRAENLQYLWYQIYRLGMRPDNIYAPWLRYVVLSAIPVGMITSVPARFILNPPNFGLLAWTLFTAAAALFLSTRFWRYAVKFYASASS